MCSVSWLLLVKLSVLANWLARKTPLRTSLYGKEIISTRPRLESVYDFLFSVLFHCLLSVYLVPGPTHTSMARCSLFMLKVSLKHHSTDWLTASSLCTTATLISPFLANCAQNWISTNRLHTLQCSAICLSVPLYLTLLQPNSVWHLKYK